MITALLLRNYKNYNNMHFVQVCNNINEKYSVYVGNNGVGKSAILESLDVILNEREWNCTKNSKKEDSFICPIYLIKKAEDDKDNVLEAVSDYFWDVNETNPNIRKTNALQEFIKFKDKLKEFYRDSHYFIMIGGTYDCPKLAYFATFNNDILDKIANELNKTKEESQKELDNLRKKIEHLYRYLYIPVEESPSELLKLQNDTMQYLLNKNILEEIEKLLEEKGRGKASIVQRINENLDSFIDEVNNVITNVGGSYSFKSEDGKKKKITAKDIREKILEAYFPRKTLKVNGHNVENLSSGEQRKSIIDVAYSIIVANNEKETEREIIFAIDEPESSMHISNCYSQFKRLDEIANEYRKQVLLTTHWYGFLPIIYKGNMHHIINDSEKVKVTSFSLSNIMEERRNFPDVIELKSFFDLASSIITYIRTRPDDIWIICEGKDDKKYLECILTGEKNINILPVGGCGNVSKLHEMICSVLIEKNEDRICKVLFLIDTDKKFKHYFRFNGCKNMDKNIKFRRLQVEDETVKLYDPTAQGNIYSQTEIEDCLDGNTFFEALIEAINSHDDSELKEELKDVRVKVNAKHSMLRGDDTILEDLLRSETKKKIIEFAESEKGKNLIVKHYVKIFNELESKPEHALKGQILSLWK